MFGLGYSGHGVLVIFELSVIQLHRNKLILETNNERHRLTAEYHFTRTDYKKSHAVYTFAKFNTWLIFLWAIIC